MNRPLIQNMNQGDYLSFLKTLTNINNDKKIFFQRILEYQHLAHIINNINSKTKDLKICGFYPLFEYPTILLKKRMPYIITIILDDSNIGWSAYSEANFIFNLNTFFKNKYFSFNDKKFWNTSIDCFYNKDYFSNTLENSFYNKYPSDYRMIKNEIQKFVDFLNKNPIFSS